MKKLFTVLLLLMFACPVFAETVVYNPNSGKYHKLDCQYAKKCKVCIKIDKKQAKAKGGIPCKVCGG